MYTTVFFQRRNFLLIFLFVVFSRGKSLIEDFRMKISSAMSNVWNILQTVKHVIEITEKSHWYMIRLTIYKKKWNIDWFWWTFATFFSAFILKFHICDAICYSKCNARCWFADDGSGSLNSSWMFCVYMISSKM